MYYNKQFFINYYITILMYKIGCNLKIYILKVESIKIAILLECRHVDIVQWIIR